MNSSINYDMTLEELNSVISKIKIGKNLPDEILSLLEYAIGIQDGGNTVSVKFFFSKDVDFDYFENLKIYRNNIIQIRCNKKFSTDEILLGEEVIITCDKDKQTRA